ncbi:hypothetical protein [Streptomyces anulatus]|uniref:hypothetical protein n=1 Tax=Streptomyces anulatus TaxID=1892 RepID=UPI00382CA5E7
MSASRSALRQAWTSRRPTSRELCLGIGVYAKADRLFLGRAVRHQGPELLEPEVVSCSAWRAATPTPDVAMYAGVGRK